MENTRYKVLLVEDDKVDRVTFEKFVKDHRLLYDCATADSVSDARAKLGGGHFDIVIADYLLGDGTAFDLLALAKDTPIILVTGAGDEETAVKAWRQGAYDYLIKDQERNYLTALPITVGNAIKHKKTEEKLHLLSQAIMSTDDSVYITNMENRIIFVNRAFCKTYGYDRQEIIGKDSNVLWIGKTQSRNTRSVFGVTGSTRQVGFYHRRKNDSVFPVSLSRSIIKDPNGKEIAVVGVTRDISDRIEIEEELRVANVQLTERNRLKSELAVMVSRASRTLLAALKDIIRDAIAGTLGEISPQLHENLNLAQENISKAQKLITEFLDISKIGTGEMKLEHAKLKLKPLVSEVIQAMSPVLAKKKNEPENS